MLKEVSDPRSPRYGRYPSKAEIDALTNNERGREALLAYLREGGVTDIYVTKSR